MTLETLTPSEACARIEAGALLIDVRDADEYARKRIPGAIHVPLGRTSELPLQGRPLIVYCKSGRRTTTHAARILEAARGTPVCMLKGGLDAWSAAGFPTLEDRSQPLELARQVQIVVGTLALIGALLGWFVSAGFFVIPAFVGAGLILAGVTGWCGMAKLLVLMPWNRRMAV